MDLYFPQRCLRESECNEFGWNYELGPPISYFESLTIRPHSSRRSADIRKYFLKVVCIFIYSKDHM